MPSHRLVVLTVLVLAAVLGAALPALATGNPPPHFTASGQTLIDTASSGGPPQGASRAGQDSRRTTDDCPLPAQRPVDGKVGSACPQPTQRRRCRDRPRRPAAASTRRTGGCASPAPASPARARRAPLSKAARPGHPSTAAGLGTPLNPVDRTQGKG